MTHSYGIAGLILALLLSVEAQNWPSELTIPESNYSDQEQPQFYINSEIFYEQSFRSRDYLLWNNSSGPFSIKQSINHEQYIQGNRQKRRFMDISGSATRVTGVEGLKVGLGWSPVINTNIREQSGGHEVIKDIGPLLKYDYRGIPAVVKFGVSGRSHLDTLMVSREAISSRLRNHWGVYGSFDIGDYSRPIPGYPVYAHVSGFGRSVNKEGMALFSGALLAVQEIETGDSLIFYYGDTFFNGKLGYLGESDDGVSLVNTPWKMERNYRISAGVKGKERGVFSPALYYSFSKLENDYPSSDKYWVDYSATHKLGTEIVTDTSKVLSGTTSFSIRWREWDRKQGGSDNTNLRLDYNPAFQFSTRFRLPLSFVTSYSYSVSRILTEPADLKTQSETVGGNNLDRLFVNHNLSLSSGNFSGLHFELYWDFNAYTLHNLKSHNSSQNRTDRGQRLGLKLNYDLAHNIALSEHLIAEARVSEYHFPVWRQEPEDRPGYSRVFSSATEAWWMFHPSFGLNALWEKSYNDDGYWYGREYMIEELEMDSTLRTDFYAVENKSIRNAFDLTFMFRGEKIEARAGGRIVGIHDINWNKEYKTGNRGLIFEPYAGGMFQVGFVDLEFYVRHISVFRERGSFGKSGIWDLRLYLTGGVW
ncbi:hypothetical protein QA601_08190 [Chitinispirillales bacterium ANBcel5]|uniref:hypothetical protein n=1 Tax=Cellulosispirillum alkaliphilum TaxID=3039283 RepID=UPI002A53FC8A|nr:hypothetical protein [Chitinispirillales bacterium ANBcel5]